MNMPAILMGLPKYKHNDIAVGIVVFLRSIGGLNMGQYICGPLIIGITGGIARLLSEWIDNEERPGNYTNQGFAQIQTQ